MLFIIPYIIKTVQVIYIQARAIVWRPCLILIFIKIYAIGFSVIRYVLEAKLCDLSINSYAFDLNVSSFRTLRKVEGFFVCFHPVASTFLGDRNFDICNATTRLNQKRIILIPFTSCAGANVTISRFRSSYCLK
jgi:hypothetical protein